ncbi:MAG: tyrosine recombinase XerC [Oscillospiraceae bacterium]|jgi:site-specific recombinase XerD|nr:tyrosine recombinase XerC [Oscillospiraceae bacterium]
MAHYKECGELVEHFLSYVLTIKGRSLGTVDGYYQDLKLFFKFMVRHLGFVEGVEFNEINTALVDIEFIRKITQDDIYAFFFFINLERHNKNTTRARKVSAIKSLFKYLINNKKLLDVNPTENLDAPKLKGTLPKHLSLEQSEQMLEHVDGNFAERDYCIIMLFLNCGMRLAELVSLNFSDISSNPIKITGKGNRERIIYLNSACQEAIKNYIKKRISKKSEVAFFLNKNGTRISKRRVQEIVEFNLKKNNFFGFSVHKLRHTAATLMFQHGNVDIRTLQEILGHKNLSTTQIYTHVSSAQIEKATGLNPLSNFKKTFEG